MGLSPADCSEVCVIPCVIYWKISVTREIYVLQFEFGLLKRVGLTTTRVNARFAEDIKYQMVCVPRAYEGLSLISLWYYGSNKVYAL